MKMSIQLCVLFLPQPLNVIVFRLFYVYCSPQNYDVYCPHNIPFNLCVFFFMCLKSLNYSDFVGHLAITSFFEIMHNGM